MLTQWSRLFPLVPLLLSTACEPTLGAEAITEDPLYGLGSLGTAWPGGVVPICWRDGAGDRPDLQARVKGILAETWSKHANITFTGFGDCDPNLANKVTIHFENDSRGFCSLLGEGAVDLTLIGNDASANQQRFRYEVIHELGHALGFAHEQERPDNWDAMGNAVACNQVDDGRKAVAGGTNFTATYDGASVMSYCGGFVQDLSPGDIAAVRSIYGARTLSPREEMFDAYYLSPGLRIHSVTPHNNNTWTFNYQDVNPGYGASNMANWKSAYVNRDGRADLVEVFYLNPGLRVHTLITNLNGTRSFSYQDVNPGYGANDMANWKIADINGDSCDDMVDTFFLGVGRGLRVHTLISNCNGTWRFGYQDVNSGYGANDMSNWKVADINGDGSDDMVSTYFIGSGHGLRMHMLISDGAGRFRFEYRDINAGYGASNVTNWKVANINGDACDDMIEPYFLGIGHGLRIHTAVSDCAGGWRFLFQDIDPNYGTDDMANWKVADINGDGKDDLVDTYFAGPGAGLRIHSAVSTGDGTFTFSFNDINSGYGTNDMSNWKVMDVSGDGLDDLVDTYFLGRGQGMRMHWALSRGDGTFRFHYQDVNSGYGVNDMANWKVAR